ncbi:MAG: hypothetical protein JWO31_2535 [Phycisphaerales bacterium]|nr:hypothetical protein [Phycisphaerales bacterium]
MKPLEITNLPDEVYERIEKLARASGTSVADVAASFITEAVAGGDEAEVRLLADVRAEREQMASEGVWITDADIRAGREWGRK